MLTRHETEQMRKAWKAGYNDATSGAMRLSDKEFKGQPGRNLRNYIDGYMHGALDRKAEAA